MVIIDGTVVRTHRHAAGAEKKGERRSSGERPSIGTIAGRFLDQAPDRCRRPGKPGGVPADWDRVVDVKRAEPLIATRKADACMLDKAYDSGAVVAAARR